MQHWLRGGKEDQADRIADLMKFGIAEAEAREYVSAESEPALAVFGVWPQNEEVLAVFFRLRRKWRLHPFTGVPVGLDAAQVESTLRLMRIPPKRWPDLSERLELCAETVLAARE